MKTQSSRTNANVVAHQSTRSESRNRLSRSFAALLVLAAGLLLTVTPSFAQNANPNDNPNQIAILRWYHANTAPSIYSMSGHNSSPVAFDGENIWVASTDGYVAEYSTDGKLLYGPTALPSGSYPVGMAFDGTNIWITEFYSKAVDRINVNTKASTRFTTGNNPYFIAFDGANMWIVNNGDATVAAYKASNGTLVGAPHGTMGTGATGVAFDGQCIWVANTNSNNVAIIDANSTGGHCPSTLAGKVIATGVSQPFALAYDGKNMWVAYRGPSGSGPGGVVELSGTSGAVLGTFGGCSSTNGTGTLLFDGAYIWVAGGASGGACKYKSSLFAPPLGLVGKYSVGGSVNQVAFDGINIWGTLGGTGVAKF